MERHRTVAYLRVSALDQDVEKNKADILCLANNKNLGQVHFVEEKASGKVPWKSRRIAGIIEPIWDRRGQSSWMDGKARHQESVPDEPGMK